jgi:hypothetical protein
MENGERKTFTWNGGYHGRREEERDPFIGE